MMLSAAGEACMGHFLTKLWKHHQMSINNLFLLYNPLIVSIAYYRFDSDSGSLVKMKIFDRNA
jgi:hypothetical protein